MPDQYGRPTFNDWMGMAQGLASVQDNIMKQQEYADKKSALDLAGQLLKEPNTQIDPQKYSPHVAFQALSLAAQQEAAQLSASNERLRQKALSYEAQLTEDMPRITKIIGLANSKDNEGFWKEVESFYNERIYDGAKVKFLPDNKMEVTENDGTIRIAARPDKQDVLQTLSFYQDPKNYIAVNLHLDNEILKNNAAAMSKASQLYDKNGRPLGVAVTYLTDPQTKKSGIVYFNSYTGQPVDIDQYKKNGLLTEDQLKSSLEIMSKQLGLQIGAQNLMNSRIEFGNKVLEGENKRLDIKKKQNDLSGDDELFKVYEDLRKTFDIAPNRIDQQGNPYTYDEKTAIAARNYLRSKGYDAIWNKEEDGKWSLIELQKGLLPMDANKQKNVRGGAGLMSGDGKTPKKATPGKKVRLVYDPKTGTMKPK